MLNPILAHTSSGVETVSQLDKDALDKLARWLCDEKAFHDFYDALHSPNRTYDAASDDRFEFERDANGGYCDRCRDFAGGLLANFDLVARQ